MCGIAGTFSQNGFFSIADVKVAADALSHRGPDSDGFWYDDVVALGHRRLSIIDLDPRSSQPMSSVDGKYKIIFNGEIYNYLELKEELKKNHPSTPFSDFKTTSDTEVVIKLFELYGCEFVHHLNGMFAMALYDIFKKKLFIFRDRLGIKPLYFYDDGNKNIFFASELKALLATKKINTEVNLNAIIDFLQLGFIPAPKTIYQKIHKLNSGCYLQIDNNGIEEKRYWSAAKSFESEKVFDENKIINSLETKLFESVKIQLRSDVPYGVFLSGGIDSSLLSAIASKIVIGKLNTFSIGFKEQSHNEASYAKAVAEHLKTNHHEFIVSYQDALNLINSFADVYDEPFADASGIPTMLVSKLARQHVKVVLSGEGGDELFHGYGTMRWAERLNAPYMKHMRGILKMLFSQMSSRHKRIAALLNYSTETFLPAHIFSQEQYYFNQSEIKEVLLPSVNHIAQKYFVYNQKYLISEYFNKLKSTEDSASALQAFYELSVTLQDDLLTKVDRASMKYSLEARVPYLDHNVVEYALTIPSSIKTKKGIAKYPLKTILYSHVPQQLFNRPKQGFSIPLAKWLHGELSFLIEEYLSKDKIEKTQILNFKPVAILISRFKAGDDYLYNRIWNLIVLQMWLLKNKI